MDDVITSVETAPIVATTNVRGKWIRLTGMAPPEYHGHKICSVCESFALYDPLHPWREELSPYCPSCGAKMEVTGMPDRENVIKGLKEQESTTFEKDGHHIRCTNCGEYWCETDREGNKFPNRFCPNCGKAVKWDD